MTSVNDKIRAAAEKGDHEEAARLQLVHMEPGTPILTAYLLIRSIQPVLPSSLYRLVERRLADTGITEAAMSAIGE